MEEKLKMHFKVLDMYCSVCHSTGMTVTRQDTDNLAIVTHLPCGTQYLAVITKEFEQPQLFKLTRTKSHVIRITEVTNEKAE